MRALSVEELEFVSGGEIIVVTAPRPWGGMAGAMSAPGFEVNYFPVEPEQCWPLMNSEGDPIVHIDFDAFYEAFKSGVNKIDRNGNGSGADEYAWAAAVAVATGFEVASLLGPAGRGATTFLQVAKVVSGSAAGKTLVGLYATGLIEGYIALP